MKERMGPRVKRHAPKRNIKHTDRRIPDFPKCGHKGKMCYPNAKVAERARKRLLKTSKHPENTALHVYPCRTCGSFHVGHRRNTEKAN